MNLFFCHKSLDYRTTFFVSRAQNSIHQAVNALCQFGCRCRLSVNTDRPWQNTNSMNKVIYNIFILHHPTRWQVLKQMDRIDCQTKTADALKQPWRTSAHRNRSPVAEVFLCALHHCWLAWHGKKHCVSRHSCMVRPIIKMSSFWM